MTPNEYKERRAALDAEFYGNSSSYVRGGSNNPNTSIETISSTDYKFEKIPRKFYAMTPIWYQPSSGGANVSIPQENTESWLIRLDSNLNLQKWTYSGTNRYAYKSETAPQSLSYSGDYRWWLYWQPLMKFNE